LLDIRLIIFSDQVGDGRGSNKCNKVGSPRACGEIVSVKNADEQKHDKSRFAACASIITLTAIVTSPFGASRRGVATIVWTTGKAREPVRAVSRAGFFSLVARRR
jgi:hypothetical protein